MSKADNQPSKNQKTNNREIEEMKRDIIPELEKIAFKNYHRVLLRTWLKFIGILTAGVALSAGFFYFVPHSISSVAPSTIEEISKTILAPSVTMNGLFITFVPVISFFYIQELKEKEEYIKKEQKEREKDFKDKDDLKVMNSAYGLGHTFWYNVRVGVLRYTQTYLTVTISSLFFLILFYAAMDASLFLITCIILLSVIFTGVFPIISMALYLPALKLRQYIMAEKIIKKIEYEG